ncbi:MAG: GNAT family N-acetyltransferase [Deltaproteobacteria bacterium]|nr:GNAT family N-acetyltransferase [Deltaproteobacteria bacterium]
MGIDEIKKAYPEKFVSEEQIFHHVHRGDRIFIGTGCGEPLYLVRTFIDYVKTHPKAFSDAELFQIWALGVAPYANDNFKYNFRHNSFFIGSHTRDLINNGLADYTPIFLSQAPDLFYRRYVPIDVAIIQNSLPDDHGFVSLGVSVDITKAAMENAKLVISQVNSNMPYVRGDGLIPVSSLDFIILHDEPILEYETSVPNEIARRIGNYVKQIIQDGDTIQVGYGGVPNAILANLHGKKHLGVHTELLTDGIVQLMKEGVVDNTKKSIDRGKTVASFCMGRKDSYEYIHKNPNIELRAIDYTNNPLVIARQDNMVAINSALEIDLTGQATAESIGKMFYSGIGGQADFIRGAILSRNGKTLLAMESTAENGKVSRIVPFLKEGAGVTLNRGDIHYVITEHGIAYLHGKNIRERAMELISISHPRFRPWLINKAKELNLIYRDQAFIPGKEGEYPEDFETYRTTNTGLEIFLRPVKISDEPLLKDFVHSLSDQSIYRRFFSRRTDMPHEFLQRFVIIDYSEKMAILAISRHGAKEEVLGVGRYFIDKSERYAELAFVVRDDYQERGICRELLTYLTYLAKKQGLLGFTAEILIENKPMLHLLQVFDDKRFDVAKHIEAGIHYYKIIFK